MYPGAAAGRALAVGDPLGALKRVALRDDPPALALRGIAMARLGDLVRAKALLQRAARGFGPKEAVSRARCVVAEAEIALVSRDPSSPSVSEVFAATQFAGRDPVRLRRVLRATDLPAKWQARVRRMIGSEVRRRSEAGSAQPRPFAVDAKVEGQGGSWAVSAAAAGLK